MTFICGMIISVIAITATAMRDVTTPQIAIPAARRAKLSLGETRVQFPSGSIALTLRGGGLVEKETFVKTVRQGHSC